MSDSIEDVLHRLNRIEISGDEFHGNPFRLACTLDEPAEFDEIWSAWPDRHLPDELIRLWRVSRQGRLFEDVDYGQWGLHLMTPDSSARRTKGERLQRPRDFRPNDVVIGEFIGDLDLLVVAPDETGMRRVLVAMPLDGRRDWYSAGVDLADFLENYRHSLGDKFWEQ